MLFTVLISVVVALVIFAIANKKAKKAEQPTVPTVEEEPLGYETSSLASVIEREQPAIYQEVIDQLKDNISLAESVLGEEQPKPKAKKKMSAKPKATKTTKAPKKKKDAKNS